MASNTNGYEYISEPDDDLKCPICLKVANDPLQHEECGKLFCKKCIERHGKDKPCPNCRKQGSNYFEDIRGKRAIQALPVKCTAKCEWEGTRGKVDEHLATCEFVLVPCPKQCKSKKKKEVKQFLRKDLENHLKMDCPNRGYECEHCGEKGTFKHITQVHDKTCKSKLLTCPNAKCDRTIPRHLFDKHVATECEYTVVPCKYEKLGCDEKMERKDMVSHEQDDKLHLSMAMNIVDELKNGGKFLLMMFVIICVLCTLLAINILKSTNEQEAAKEVILSIRANVSSLNNAQMKHFRKR